MAYQPSWTPFRLSKEDVGMPDYAKALQSGIQTTTDMYKPATAASSLLSQMLKAKIDQPKANDAEGWYNLQKQSAMASNKLHNAQAEQAMMDYQQNKAFYDALSKAGKDASGDISSSTIGAEDSFNRPSAQQSGMPQGGGFRPPMQLPQQQSMSNGMTQPNDMRQPQQESQQELAAPQENVSGQEFDEGQNLNQSPQRQIISQGSPSMYKLDKLYESDPIARLGMDKRGLKKSQSVKIDPESGVTSLITTYPSGKIESQIINNGGQVAFQKAMAKEDAKTLAAIETQGLGIGNQLLAVQGLGDILADPAFGNMKQNPLLGKYELMYYAKQGTPEQQNLVGSFLTHSGDIVKQASTDFKGQFRKGEQQLLENMKPTASDSIDVAKGKISAMESMLQIMRKRAEYESNFMRDRGMSPIRARQAADLLIDNRKIKQEIEKRLYPHHTKSVEELVKIAGAK